MIQILVALDVLDENGYQNYRDAMSPILQQHGGRFVVDVKLCDVLKSPQPGPVNRLFTIEFPSVTDMEGFFRHPDYLAVRERHFEPSVGNVTRLGNFQVL